MMGVQDPGDLSIGQWAAIKTAWNRANGPKVRPPSEDELDMAFEQARLH